MPIHTTIGANTHDKLCQLKLNDKDCHVYCHVKFSVNFFTQFGIPHIIQIGIVINGLDKTMFVVLTMK